MTGAIPPLAGPRPGGVTVSLRTVRLVVTVMCGLGIAGMIVASVNDSTGAALTFGLLTSAAVVCLVVATSVARPAAGAPGPPPDEAQAAALEAHVQQLVAAGADEADLRALVREAVRMARGAAPPPGR